MTVLRRITMLLGVTVTAAACGTATNPSGQPVPPNQNGITPPAAVSLPDLPPPAGTSLPIATGSGGSGSVTLAVTQPVSVSGHANTTVACSISGPQYTAQAASVAVQGVSVSFSVTVLGYHGAGTY